ncbi:MAG: ATP-binding protein [Fusobacteriaceae bacterium]
MPEQQNIEYKQNWHDDYLKWICGFANAQGGLIYIGKDDKGQVVGLVDYIKLLDDLPNKIRNSMGISAEVNLLAENDKYFIEIVTHPYSVAISLRGRYYYRSGSTKQELTGASLNEFLLKKSGKTWDDVIEPDATLNDIDEESIRLYLNAAEKAGRLPEHEGLSISDLLEKLRLSKNGKLKRAAVILFGKNPRKLYPNMFVKIGRFGKDDADLVFQEIEEGNLFFLLHGILNQLSHKFLIRSVEFSGLNRIEKSEYPIVALREIILNALVHRTYMGAPIQIRVYDDKINFWNEGTLPEGLTFEALKSFHTSQPRNILLADVCFMGGFIDAWGRGTLKIFDACKEARLPEPEIKEFQGGILVTLFKDNLSEEQLAKKGLNERQLKAVHFVKGKGKISNADFQKLFKVSKPTATRNLAELVEKFGLFEKIGQTGAGTVYVLK